MLLNFFRCSLLAITLGVLLGACANPAGSGGATANLTVVNNTGVALTLEAGDFSSALKSGYSAPYKLSLGSSNAGVAFSLPASTGLNLWKRDSTGTITSYLSDSSSTNVRSFQFSSGIRYTLTLNNGSYTLAEGSSSPVTTVPATVTTRVFPTTTRSPYAADLAESVNAKDLTVSNGTVVSRRTASGWEYAFLAEVSSPASAKLVSFVKARVELLDESGGLLYNTSQIPSTTNGGFTYLTVPAQGRYLSSSSGTYTYGNYDLFPGGKAYLCWVLYLSDASGSTDPLFALDINRVKGLRLALIGANYSSLGIEPVPSDLALLPGAATISGGRWQGAFSTPATSTVWWQIGTSSRVLFRDASDRLLDSAYVDLGTGSSWLVGPGKSSTFTAKVPTELQATAVSAVALMSSSVGVPLAASLSSRAVWPTSQDGQEAAAAEAQALLDARP